MIIINYADYYRIMEDIIYEELNYKFNYEVDLRKDNLYHYLDRLDSETKDEYINYLLSLPYEDTIIFSWNYMLGEKENNYTGKAYDLFNEVKKAEEDYFKHLGGEIPYNYTKELSNDYISIKPLEKEDIKYYLNLMSNEVDNRNFYYGLQVRNNEEEMWFKIENKDNIKVGLIGLSLDKMSIMCSEKSYNLFYYILPSYRNNLYATNAVKLFIDSLKKKLIIRDNEDELCKYKFNRTPIECKIINIYVREANIFSLKIINKLNTNYIGKIKAYYNKLFLDWNLYQLIIDPVSEQELIDKEFKESFKK